MMTEQHLRDTLATTGLHPGHWSITKRNRFGHVLEVRVVFTDTAERTIFRGPSSQDLVTLNHLVRRILAHRLQSA